MAMLILVYYAVMENMSFSDMFELGMPAARKTAKTRFCLTKQGKVNILKGIVTLEKKRCLAL